MKPSISSMAAVAAGLVAPAAIAGTAVAGTAPSASAHHKLKHHAVHVHRHAHRDHVARSGHKLTALDRRYLKLYNEAAHKFGMRAPGRNIVLNGIAPHKAASVAAIEKSVGTLAGMVAPASKPVQAAAATSSTVPSATTTTTTAAQTSSAPASGLTSCIISRESGGDPSAVNASGHMGEGQWDESTWLADGGGAYGATPLDASASEQQQVIASQVAAGNTGQWTNYDGC